VYASTDYLNGYISHFCKGDRRMFNMPPSGEHSHGVQAHFLSNRDCMEARPECLDSYHTWGHESIVRFRLPIQQQAAVHIITGQMTSVCRDMKIIKIFDHYRPKPVPEVWWFVETAQRINI
jgi:hypothetical protein